ncbi:MAG: RNA polymerase sigma factor [Nitrospirae bacterium]|nr:RNA polymerase sigma factor [Nitrospirota bacterium]
MTTFKSIEILNFIYVTFLSLISLSIKGNNFNSDYWYVDVELVNLVKKGDNNAFEKLVERHMNNLYRYCYFILKEQMDAEDASKEAFVRSFENINSIDDGRRYYSWVKTTAKNICFDMLKNRQREGGELPEDDVFNDSMSIGPKPPDKLVEEKETKAAIWKALSELNDYDREIIVLRHFGELTFKQIAPKIGITENAVKLRFYRALEKLSTMLGHLKGDFL